MKKVSVLLGAGCGLWDEHFRRYLWVGQKSEVDPPPTESFHKETLSHRPINIFNTTILFPRNLTFLSSGLFHSGATEEKKKKSKKKKT